MTFSEMTNVELIEALHSSGQPFDLCREAAVRLEIAVDELDRLVAEVTKLRAHVEGMKIGDNT